MRNKGKRQLMKIKRKVINRQKRKLTQSSLSLPRASSQWANNTSGWICRAQPWQKLSNPRDLQSINPTSSRAINSFSLGRTFSCSSASSTPSTRGWSRLNKSSTTRLTLTFHSKEMTLWSREPQSSRGRSSKYSLAEYCLQSAKLLMQISTRTLRDRCLETKPIYFFPLISWLLR